MKGPLPDDSFNEKQMKQWESASNLLQHFQEVKINYQNTLCDRTITWLSKPKEDTSTQEYKVLPVRNIQYKVHNKLKQNESKAHFDILQHNQVGILPVTQGCFNLQKSRNLRLHMNQEKIKQDMMLLIVAEQECVSILESVSWFTTLNSRNRRKLPQPNKEHKCTKVEI